MMMIVAVAAMTFASCGQKAAAPAEGEATEVTTEQATEAAEKVISDLKAKLEAKDASAVQEIITAIQEKVADYIKSNPEAAKAYVEQVQAYLKENVETIKSVVGANTIVNTAVETLTAASADDVVSTISNALTTTEEASEAAADSVKENTEQAIESVKENAKEKTDFGRQLAVSATGILYY